ncbi:MAG: ComEC/Rec2 family competence protein [Acidimicrobiales bacterium]|nr:ComEC/Rec2 family competence protein [Acidimicrobiales bacterium]
MAGLSDAATVALATATWAGAALAPAVPWTLVVVLLVAAALVPRPALWCVAAFVLAGTLGAAAHAGLAPPEPAPYDGWATLVSDPEPTRSGQRVELRLDGRRLEAWARGGAAGSLVERLSGERVEVSGRIEAFLRADEWRVARHLAGRFEIVSVRAWEPGHPVTRAANALRRTLARGAAPLPEDTRALFLGFVLGDDRGRSELVTDDFRGAGLTHLLAVSGQNVAFVLAVADPALRRLPLRGRWVATVGLLVFFALLTRFEPSVLRATAMAALVTLATTWGREASSVRVLALAVAGLLLIDPLLVGALGFRLSVAASAGIAVLAPPLTRALPGPRWLVLPLAVGLAAQIGVAPLLLAGFGGLPVVAPAANLAAVPAAGPISTWGMTAGLLAGVFPGLAGILHVPTRLLVGWIAGVARVAVALPLGQLGPAGFVVVVGAGAAALLARHRGRVAAARVGAAVMAVALLVPGVTLRLGAAPVHGSPAADAELWRSGPQALLVLGGRTDEGDLLQGLREAGVLHLDLVVCRSPAGALHQVVADLRRRYGPFVLVAPSDGGLPGAIQPESGSDLRVGGLIGHVEVSSDSVDIEVRPAPGADAGPV